MKFEKGTINFYSTIVVDDGNRTTEYGVDDDNVFITESKIKVLGHQ